MRAVLFEGTPEEFARVEAAFRAGGDLALQTRTIALPRVRPTTWPELGEEQCHRLARRVLERAPARLVEALVVLAEAQNLVGEQTIEAWADYADREPEELCGTLAELARSASRGFIELFGCENAPERVKGAAHMLLQRVVSPEGPGFLVRRGLMRALAELDRLDTHPSDLVQRAEEEAARPTPKPSPSAAAAVPTLRRSPPTHRPPTTNHPAPSSPRAAARPGQPQPSGPPGGVWNQLATFLAPFAPEPHAPKVGAGGKEPPAPAAKPSGDPFSLLGWTEGG